MEMCSFGCCIEGDGEGGKRGTGGENPEGEGGLQPGCPPSPGLSPQDSGKPVLRVPSTQIIKNKSQANGHKGKPVLRRWSTQSIKEHRKGTGHQRAKSAEKPPGGNGCKIKKPYFTGRIHRISSPFFPVLCGLNRILLRIGEHSFNHGFFVYLS